MQPLAAGLGELGARRLRRGWPREGSNPTPVTRGVTDAECTSDRTVASSRAQPRTRRGCQQHRQYQHHRLQGRRCAVRGISLVGGAHRPEPRPRQLRARPRHLAQPRPARSSGPAIRSTSQSTATPSWWCRRRAASATPATARCRSTARATSSPAKAMRCSAMPARLFSSRPTIRSASVKTAPSACARATRKPIRRAAPCGWSPSRAPSNCRRTAAAPSRPSAMRSQADQGIARHPGRAREVERERCRRDVAHDRNHTRLHPARDDHATAERPRSADLNKLWKSRVMIERI